MGKYGNLNVYLVYFKALYGIPSFKTDVQRISEYEDFKKLIIFSLKQPPVLNDNVFVIPHMQYRYRLRG